TGPWPWRASTVRHGVPDPCRTVDARQGHGPVRNAHLGARLLRLTAVYGSVRLLPCGASMWGIAC
ncbi:hypothetical protein FRD82_21755, partial [Mycobacterium tuberculosis]